MSRPQMRALQTTLLSACMYGLGGGLIGGAALFLVNRTEALVLPFRLNLLFPARMLFSMLGRPPPTQATKGIGCINFLVGLVYSGVIGIARGAMAWYGIRGPIADFMFMSEVGGGPECY
ncbi:hypothetical protein BDQ12DRAFT_724275 [Crucibulum laeve]|uniref:Uncharacterized protein n=1 Tax=Crucibulum laeve TaxID=68775 RepID=A0A5C3LYH2_9AGAR|nr:hypothetical protein BDQ12DRAFT_724275 [Crucibulum laeve]